MFLLAEGIGNTFYGQLIHKEGLAQHCNFHNYRMIRINEVPKRIQVYFVRNDLDTMGLGELPFPPVFGAMANALYKMKGQRYYNKPFKEEPGKPI